MIPDVFIYDALRSPFGKGTPDGALFEVRPVDLLGKCLKALANRNNAALVGVSDVLIGCVPVGGQADNVARTALLSAGWPETISGLQMNRLQASGLAALGFGAAKIKSGWSNLLVVGGLESSSRTQGANYRGPISSDPDLLHQIGSIPADVAADLVATLHRFDVEQLTDFAWKSVEKSRLATANNHFKNSIVPICDQNGISILSKDEMVPEQLTHETMLEAPPPFRPLHRAGFQAVAVAKYPLVEKILPQHNDWTSAFPADNTALLLLGNEKTGKEIGLKPRARIIDMVSVGTDPTLNHGGAVVATEDLLKKTNNKPTDVHLWSINEGFAAPALWFQRTFKIPDDALNVSGGNLAFGDPMGANGAALLTLLLDDLQRLDKRRGLLALSAEGGLGISLLVETL